MAEHDVAFSSADGTRLSATWCSAGPSAAPAVLFAHGITGEREEGGLFTALAGGLATHGISSLRFDFRAHGRSEGEQLAMDISGEIADVRAATGWLRSQGYVPAGFVGASFGAVATCEYLAGEFDEARCLVLLNPVLDVRRTFLEPTCEWPRGSFNPAGFEHLRRQGFLWLDGHFKIGRRLIEEMGTVAPAERLRSLSIPILTIHGDADTCVPYDISREHGTPNPASRFVTVPGADHGFGRPEERSQVVDATLQWLLEHMAR